MALTEEYEGFVPVTLYLANHRVEGKLWKFANRRLLQQMEEDRRQFLPVVLAKLFPVGGSSHQEPLEFDVLAVSKDHVMAVEPKDIVTPRASR